MGCEQADESTILRSASALGVLGPGAGSGPRLIATLCDPEVGARAVGEVIRKEPAICARVLRVANSPLYGQGRTVSNIERALVLLGLDAVRGIATAVCLDHTMTRRAASLQLDTQAVLQHCIATAAASESLAQICCPELSSDAFIAGLLHNLGIILQAHLDPAGTARLCNAHRERTDEDLRSLELEHVAAGHERCAAVMFGAWQLPQSLVEAVRHHHAPAESSETDRDLASLVHLGSNLALQHGNTFALEPKPAPVDAGALARFGLADAEFGSIVAELSTRVSALRGALLAA